jgi:hypothetical protein
MRFVNPPLGDVNSVGVSSRRIMRRQWLPALDEPLIAQITSVKRQQVEGAQKNGPSRRNSSS